MGAKDQRRLAAIMFTDMVGYSALSQRNEALALQLLEEHQRLVRSLLSGHGGREVETAGDSFLIEFPSALAAVQGAIEIQQALRERNQIVPTERRVLLRIGIHVGDVVQREGGIKGDAVNIAARIEPLATPGGICVSEDVARQIRNKVSHPMIALAPTDLKNIQLSVVVHRVVMPWEEMEPIAETPSTPAAISKKSPGKLVAVLTILVVLGLLAFTVFRTKKPQPVISDSATNSTAKTAFSRPVESLAVLPLVNHSGDAAQEYFVDGMTDALIAELSQISSLKRVISRTTIMQFKGTRKVMSQIARELNVDVLVEGSVQREGTRVRITAQLIDGASDRHLWATNYVREARDILMLQGEVALAIAREIKIKLSPQEQSQLTKARPVNPEAHEAYLRGRVHWNRRSGEELKKAIEYFTLAVEKDPRFALAWASLGSSLYLQIEYARLPSLQITPQAKAAVNKALELDDSLAEAHAALGFIQFSSDWAWEAAETSLKRAIELDPNYATGHHWYSVLLRQQGRWEETEAQIKRAVELDPLSPIINLNLGYFFYFSRDFDRALEQSRKTLELDPNFLPARNTLAECYLKKGQYEEAIAEFQKLRSLVPNNPYALGNLGHAFGISGRKPEALQALAQLEKFAQQGFDVARMMAFIHLSLGDKMKTLEILEMIVEKRLYGAVTFKVEPNWDSIRSEPRFIALLKKIGLEP